MIPYDVVGAIREGLLEDEREPDGLLHCSSDLLGSLRHAQLHIAGAPKKPQSLISKIRLKTGTMWHEYLNRLLIKKGWPVMHEVKLTEWLPEGWSGTADHLWWDVDKRAFRLTDLKTQKGEGMKWLLKSGTKDEHLWQTSAYYHALVEARFPMVRELAVLYLPMNDVQGEEIEPEFIDFEPVPKDEVWDLMHDRWAKADAYIASLAEFEWPESPLTAELITDALAPPIERVQRLFKNGPKWEVKLVPHWSTMFCPFDLDLCDCSTQGQTKIGEYVDGAYKPRKGYEDIEPVVAPPAAPRLRLAA